MRWPFEILRARQYLIVLLSCQFAVWGPGKRSVYGHALQKGPRWLQTQGQREQVKHRVVMKRRWAVWEDIQFKDRNALVTPVSVTGSRCGTSSTTRRKWKQIRRRWPDSQRTRRSSLYVSARWCFFISAGFLNWFIHVSSAGSTRSMAEGELQWGVHCLDPY